MQLHAKQRITIAVNGEATETDASTLAELIAELGFVEGTVATARNGEFVPRAARAATKLTPDDKVEVVAPRQGG